MKLSLVLPICLSFAIISQAAPMNFDKRRFGVEHTPEADATFQEVKDLAQGSDKEAQAGNLSGAMVRALLAKAPACDQQDRADEVINLGKEFGGKKLDQYIDVAKRYRQLERNTPKAGQPSELCNKKPKNKELEGLTQAQDPTGDPKVNDPEVEDPKKVEDPEKEDPEKEDPEKEDPEKEDPEKEDPEKEDPEKEDPEKEDPEKEDPEKEDPEKEDPEKEDPEKEDPEKEDPEKEDPEKEDPEKEDPEKEDPEKEDPEKEDPEKEDPEKEDPEKEDPEKEDPEKEDPEKEDPEKEDPEKEDPEKETGENVAETDPVGGVKMPKIQKVNGDFIVNGNGFNGNLDAAHSRQCDVQKNLCFNKFNSGDKTFSGQDCEDQVTNCKEGPPVFA